MVALAAAVWTYQPTTFGSTYPRTVGDPLAFYAWIQNIVETGWYEDGPRLAAPFGQNSHSYSDASELLYALVGKVLVPLTGSPAQAVLWAVVLSFPAAAILAVVTARWLRIGRFPAVLIGVVFALLPDHFSRGNGHYGLAQTWTVPIGVLAAVSLLHVPATTSRRTARLREAAILVGCVSVSLTNAYYAVFTGILVAGAAVLLWRRSGLRSAWRPFVARALALGLPLLAASEWDSLHLPKPLGFPSMLITRSVSDADVYGGKIFAMLLPSSAHRDIHMRALRLFYDQTFPFPAEGPALGLVASFSFVALVIWAVLVYARPRSAIAAPVLATLAALTWVALFAYVVGGLGQIWALALNGGGLRAWSRMHVFIALLALLAAGTALDRVRRRGLQVALVTALIVVALWDQTSPLYRADLNVAESTRSEVTTLTDAIGAQVPPNAMLYQYPAVSFPVVLRNVAPASAYDGFLPYLYSHGLRWSYGGLQGDPKADWQAAVDARPAEEQVALIQAAGFAGMVVDTMSLTSDPDALAAMRASLGAPTVVSTSGRWEFYRLSPPSATCQAGQGELADLALRPPLMYPGSGFTPVGNVLRDTTADPATLRILTLRDNGWRNATIAFTVEVPALGVVLTMPDGTTRSLAAGSDEVHWTGAIQPTTTIEVRRAAPDETPVVVHSFSAQPTLSAAASSCLRAASDG